MDNERHALDELKKNKKLSFYLTSVEPGWGNITLTISNIEINDNNHEGFGELTYDIDGYDQAFLDSVGKTEQELADHCSAILIEMLEEGLKQKDQKILDTAKDIVDKTTRK